ncbi:MAG: hypothetical protein JJT94_15745 [Bernardetiaceae bacterium]|nr:hypothetical protein [Bernardetiaceae bacterium]
MQKHIISLLRRIEKQWGAGKSHVKHHSTPFKALRSIAILADKQQKQSLYPFLQGIENQNIEYQILLFSADTQKEPSTTELNLSEKITTQILHCSPQSFAIWGTPKDEGLQSFLQKSFDYLICLSDNQNPFIERILHKSQAHCRIGLKQPDSDDNLFEMLIQSPIEDAPKEILSLLKKI